MGSLFKSSKNTSTGTSSQSWGPPAAYQNAYRDLLNRGVAASRQAYDPATERMEGLTAAQQAAASGVYGSQGVFAPYMGDARSAAQFGLAPITGQAITDRMSPYLQNVVDATQAQFNTQNTRQMEDVRSQMARQGALGGTRGNVAEALTREAQMNAQNPVIANLYNQGFAQAQQAAQADAARSLQGAGTMANIGGLAQQYGYNDVNALMGLGGLEREAADIATANAAQRAGYTPGMLNWAAGLTTSLGNAAGGTSSGTTSQTTPGPSMGQQLLGAGLSIAGLFSDARIKRDIEEIGKTYDGQSIYRYRMGDDPKMRIGLLAQEVEGHHPEAVGSVGGIKTVDYGAATDDAVQRPGYDTGGVVAPFRSPSWLAPMQPKPFQQSGSGQTPSLAQASGTSGSSDGLGGLLDGVKQAHSAFGKLGHAMRTTQSPDGWSTTVNPSGASGWGNYLSNMGQSGLGALSSGIGSLFGFSHGGPVRGYEGGGVVDMRPDAAGTWSASASDIPDPPAMGGYNPFGFSDPVRRGMIAAGLGMMASQSPNFGVAVGQGGLQGMQAYDDAQKEVMAHQHRKAEAARAAEQLAARARQMREEMALKQKEHEERVRHNKAAEEAALAAATDGTYGKTGAIFQDPKTGEYFSVQFGSDGKKLIEPIGSGLTPARGVGEVDTGTGTVLIDKATGREVRTIDKDLAKAEEQKVMGRETGEARTMLPKQARALEMFEVKDDLVKKAIADATRLAEGLGATGFTGGLMKAVPGTPAYNLARAMDPIIANLGFDELQSMRVNSPTGGALGQVAVAELTMLQSTMASLDQAQNKEQLLEALKRIGETRARFRELKRKAYEQDVARFGAAAVPNPETGEKAAPAGASPAPSAAPAVDYSKMSDDELLRQLGGK